MHSDLRRRLRDEVEADLGTRPPSDLSDVLRRGRGKRLGLRVMTTLSILLVGTAIVAGGFSIGRSLSSDAAPVPPAQEGNQETRPMRSGRILQADGPYWQENTAPPPPGGDQSYHWDAFDLDTGSFLYTALTRAWVLDEEGLVAEINCRPSSVCRSVDKRATFGPGADEVSIPGVEPGSVQVIGFDGTLRETLDISAVLSQGQDLSDLAWSPDGNRLAISTEFESSTECERSSGRCGTVWILDRDGGEPQVVYTELDTRYTVLRDLAWSPNGDTLALLVAPPGYCEAQGNPDPRLVALRVAPDEPVRDETLNVYDDWGSGEEGLGCAVPTDYHLAFPFAWSPDGTRIAVHKGDGIIEISAEDGDVLARHPGEGPQGPLAWLPKP